MPRASAPVALAQLKLAAVDLAAVVAGVHAQPVRETRVELALIPAASASSPPRAAVQTRIAKLRARAATLTPLTSACSFTTRQARSTFMTTLALEKGAWGTPHQYRVIHCLEPFLSAHIKVTINEWRYTVGWKLAHSRQDSWLLGRLWFFRLMPVLAFWLAPHLFAWGAGFQGSKLKKKHTSALSSMSTVFWGLPVLAYRARSGLPAQGAQSRRRRPGNARMPHPTRLAHSLPLPALGPGRAPVPLHRVLRAGAAAPATRGCLIPHGLHTLHPCRP